MESLSHKKQSFAKIIPLSKAWKRDSSSGLIGTNSNAFVSSSSLSKKLISFAKTATCWCEKILYPWPLTAATLLN